ncbi:hypothetical protein [Kineococcus indalonis]|uniref:hypothetical protein n=1 Tax=Kineococcus indalonis TaxID=2696566 RepID=UPI0014133214|nr:hypothetical protein [Kineococcus indalonis]NAZ85922.1 hypothetical protein [Kineococcus indalonis]
MDAEHEALERALRDLGTRRPVVDPALLAVRARTRAGVLRRRRRAAAGALALVALAVPAGLSQLDAVPPPARTAPATSVPAPAPARVPDAALLDAAAVRTALPGAVDAPELAAVVDPGARAWSSLCVDATSSVVRAGRTAGWTASSPGPGLLEDVTETVLVLERDTARTHLAQVREQAPQCRTDPDGTGPWQVDEASGVGEDSVTGVAQTLRGESPRWRARVVARSADVVVDLTAETAQPDAATAVRLAEDLATEALRRAGSGVVR